MDKRLNAKLLEEKKLFDIGHSNDYFGYDTH